MEEAEDEGAEREAKKASFSASTSTGGDAKGGGDDEGEEVLR